MMPIEQHVVSLEIAKQLKETGYPQESLCHWVNTDDDGDLTVHLDDEWDMVSQEWGDCSSISNHENYAAPLASELGEQLPGNIDEFVRENLDDLDTELYFEWCNTEHPYYTPDLLAKVWLKLDQNEKGLL